MSAGCVPERRRGHLIAFEGGEGCGKSTQAARLATELGAILTREPGGTDAGRRIRSIVLDADLAGLDVRAEALLLLADRAQHVAEVVRPALDRGVDVVTDRFAGSTLAYQGWGRGLDVGELERLSAWAAGGLQPDLVMLLEVDPEVAAERLHGSPDRMEQAGTEFHRRVGDGYRALAAASPEVWAAVDGSGTVDEVAARVGAAVDAWLARERRQARPARQ